MLARTASRAASACRGRAALAASAYRSRAALAVRSFSDAAAKQHERALEALDAGAPPEAVVPLFEAAAAEGHAEATFFVGLAKAGLLEPDDGTVGGSPPEVDLEGAAAAYAKAAELGCAPAAFNYAHALRRGDGVPPDEKRAYDYYQQASDLGDARAAFQLGLAADPLHSDVRRPGGVKDGDAAVAHYRQAMDAGHFKAAVNLGFLQCIKSNGRGAFIHGLHVLMCAQVFCTGNRSRSPSSKCPRRTGELSP